MAIGFKKRAKRASTSRKRTHDALDDQEQDDAVDASPSSDSTLQAIEDVLEEQRLRARGLHSETKPKPTEATSASTTTDIQYGIHDPKKDTATGQKLLQLLDGQFTGQMGATQQDQHQELMNKYIEERLHQNAAASTTKTPAVKAPVTSDADALFAELRTQLETKRTATTTEDQEDEAGDGGVLIWNTGIAEVDLPSSFYERTVQETKRALAQGQQLKKPRIASSALPNNFSVDFNRQRTEYIQELKSLTKDEKRERGVVMQARRDQPSDDLAVSRFRRMESRKRHH